MSFMPSVLRHSSPEEPGLSRRRRGRGFSFHYDDGGLVRCAKTKARIQGLGLPPAYEEVWICADEFGHLQATGRDAAGRIQYRYHPDWRAFRDQQKFDRLEDFGRALPRLREQVEAGLTQRGDDRRLVLSALVRLIDAGAMRVGSRSYARKNKSFGATTLRPSHLKIGEKSIHLDYRGKGGRRVRKQISDRTLARTLARIDDLPGRNLFSYVDEDRVRRVDSGAVNRFIAEASGDDRFTAKTFRTWHGSVAALGVAVADPDHLTIAAMANAAAKRLHNTPAIARKSYIHPQVIALADVDRDERRARIDALDLRRAPNGLGRAEKQLIALLSQG